MIGVFSVSEDYTKFTEYCQYIIRFHKTTNFQAHKDMLTRYVESMTKEDIVELTNVLITVVSDKIRYMYEPGLNVLEELGFEEEIIRARNERVIMDIVK